MKLKWSKIAILGPEFERNACFGGVKHVKSLPTFFGGSIIPITNTIHEKPDQNLPFKLSAVVRAIYRRLYGVPATN